MQGDAVPDCPYCGRALRYVAHRWFGHSVFECEQCGDFPDFRSAITSAAIEPVDADAVNARKDSRSLPRVLIVDDSEEQRTLYAQMLEPRARVVVASRGEQALTLARDDPPDVIILDVIMPGMDGWETCRRLKADAATTDIPIIMLASNDAVDVPERARQAGVVAVLMKPCPVERLTLTVESATAARPLWRPGAPTTL